MNSVDILLLLLGASVSLHTGTAATLLNRRMGRSAAEAILTAGGAIACTLTLWLAVISLYR